MSDELHDKLGDDMRQEKQEPAGPTPTAPEGVSVYGGKYTVQCDGDGQMRCLRYGEVWRDLTGDGMVLALVQEIQYLCEKNREYGRMIGSAKAEAVNYTRHEIRAFLSSPITVKDGLLWQNGKMLSCGAADTLSDYYGLGCAEQLVRRFEEEQAQRLKERRELEQEHDTANMFANSALDNGDVLKASVVDLRATEARVTAERNELAATVADLRSEPTFDELATLRARVAGLQQQLNNLTASVNTNGK